MRGTSATFAKRAATCGAFLSFAVLVCSCGSTKLNSARSAFYAGRFEVAEQELAQENENGIDRVLMLMERGTIRQSAKKYDASAKDFDKAAHELDDMVSLSVTKDTGSMIINDRIQDYRGAPFERTLLHAFDANNYLARGMWDDAAVEARRINKSLEPEVRGDFPEDAYSRYVAGLCFELANDLSAAQFHYRKAAKLANGVTISESGKLALASHAAPAAVRGDACELVVLASTERSPTGDELVRRHRRFGKPGYVEIVADGRVLGRTVTLADTADLAYISAEKEALKRAAKTVGRIAAKEVAAHQLSRENELIGELARLILIGLLEQPDTRRWETLPRWLHAARVPCPAGLREFDLIFRDANGHETSRQRISEPLQRRGNVFVTFARDVVAKP